MNLLFMNIHELKQLDPHIISVGNHPGIIQAMLDYDFMVGHTTPSLVGIIANGKKFERYFFGRREILIPVYSTFKALPENIKHIVNMLVVATSGRRVLTATIEALDVFPNLKIGTIFAEGVSEKHAIDLGAYAKSKNVTLTGPASVGIVIPGSFKLGAIGGISQKQILSSGLLSSGGVCVLSASGGMVNEIINVVNSTHNRVSFSLSFGGDRFPLFEPVDALMTAQNDEATQAIVYYGELGGEDEYKLAKLMEVGHITKPVICYVAGTISDLFETPPQFGHAKAMAETKEESATAKREALKMAGAKVPESFSEFVEMIQTLPQFSFDNAQDSGTIENMDGRKHALIASSISKDVDGDVKLLGEDILPFAKEN